MVISLSCQKAIRFISGFSLLILIFSSGLAESKTLTVCEEACDFASIKSAVAAASPGDLIVIQSGTYQENVLLNKSLSLIGQDTGEGMPVIDAGKKGSAITILADGVTLRGFNLTNASGSRGDFYAGIRIWANDSLIRGNQASYNENGIYLTQSLNSSLQNNTMIANKFGLRVEESRNVSVIDNKMRNDRYGLLVISSDGNHLQSNLVENNEFGIQLNNSKNNNLMNNLMRSNSYNFGADSFNNLGSGNLVDGRVILYMKGDRDRIIDPSAIAGTVYCFDCQNLTIRGLNLSNNFYGIYLHNCTAITAEENNLRNMAIGVSLIKGYGNSIDKNLIIQSKAEGLQMIDSDENRAEGNHIDGYSRGILLLRSGNNQIVNNSLQDGSIGAYLCSSWDNQLLENTISTNGVGINTKYTVRNNFSMNHMVNNSLDVIRKEFDNDEWVGNEPLPLKESILSDPTATWWGTSPKKRVKIDSNPEGAAVLINEVLVDTTPCKLSFNSPGDRKLEINLVGHEPIIQNLTIPIEGEPEPVFVSFEEDN